VSAEIGAEGYFAIVPEWVLDADISDRAVRLYGVLRRYADQQGRAFPSRRTLADRLHVADPKVVDRALADLVQIGAVVVERTGGAPGQAWTANRYLVRHTRPRGRTTTPLVVDGPHLETDDTLFSQVNPSGRSTTRGRTTTPLVVDGPHPMWSNGHTPSGRTTTSPSGRTTTRTRATTNQSQTTNPPNPPSGGEDAFDEFWSAYPKKVGKQAARRAWAKATRRADPDKIIAAVREYPFDLSRIRYEKDPATWLNAGSWEDDLDAVRAARSNGHSYNLPPRDAYTAGDGTF
jgi:hypothetical protein